MIMKSGLWLIPLLLSPAAGAPTLPRPELRSGTVVRLSQTDPGGYRTVAEAADGPALLITFPPVEMTAIPEAAIRLAGRVEPGNAVLVNGGEARVYPGGSFIALVPLAGGENTITVSARGGRGETVYPLAIRREAAGPGEAPRREEYPLPLAGRVADPGGTLRYLPGGSRLLELPAGAHLRLTGREGGWLRADLGGGLSGWLNAGAVELGGEAPAEPVRIGQISFDAGNSRAWFSVPVPVPARVDYLSPDELDLVFYNAVADPPTIDLGRWEGICLPGPSGDGTARFRLRGGLDCHRWSLEYLPGGYRLSWRGRPRRGAGPVCLDPGHGGEQRGAVSPGGIAEKDANLALARAVAAELEKAGVETILTREGDETLGLAERTEIARRRGAGLFLSLHHNSVGAARDPLAASGYTVFYYQPPGRELAGEIHRALEKAGREGSGVRRRSLAVIRPTDLVTVLLETAYLSHPEDEAGILDPAGREKSAGAIAAGVLNYLTTGMSPALP